MSIICIVPPVPSFDLFYSRHLHIEVSQLGSLKNYYFDLTFQLQALAIAEKARFCDINKQPPKRTSTKPTEKQGARSQEMGSLKKISLNRKIINH